MSNNTFTREEQASVEIIDAIKEIWGRHGGPCGAITIGLEGLEITNAILKALYELSARQNEAIARFVEASSSRDPKVIAQAIRRLHMNDDTERDVETQHTLDQRE